MPEGEVKEAGSCLFALSFWCPRSKRTPRLPAAMLLADVPAPSPSRWQRALNLCLKTFPGDSGTITTHQHHVFPEGRQTLLPKLRFLKERARSLQLLF